MRKCGIGMGVIGLLGILALPGGFQAGKINVIWFILGEVVALSFIWLGAKLTQK